MYLRKVEGPRAVTLPDGRILTRADLPSPDTERWVASRKARLLLAITVGLVSRDYAIETYGLSEEELQSWERLARRHGPEGLRVTTIQKYRQP
ncbi:MAG: CtrA inhibitor SciP [Limimaricola soesokkakensis]|uniref:Uncharacterized protein DUF1153 n=1 Tax=Limimaricola soesokkakensis TaxID=1343159 RepID=A0A1X6ZGU1_9RHOB|nr:DUF1153 domain-containing protein [Limimaricola soesokkakensis]PSK86062.1 uncharacterized protein DUF1153 [Limimaricola soesokkakensis]SLN50873.1 hypothetical protein LOS8367_02311 [Limimaricola soesokkakensis]